jgi:secreted trypsin-like serine protease
VTGRRTARVVTALVTVVAAVLAAAAPAVAIAHGTPVPPGRYRFAVMLTMTGIPRLDGSHYSSACSAALVARRWIITAGHCFHDAARNRVGGPVPYPTTATVGRTDVSDAAGHVVAVTEVVQSPIGDLALARLAAPVRGIRPLAVATREPRTGDLLRMVGWGSLTAEDPVPASHLQTGLFRVSSVAATTVGVTGYAPEPDTSACTYDSGAPYFVVRPGRAALVSVESGGPDCPHALEETTVRADVLGPWIRSVVG